MVHATLAPGDICGLRYSRRSIHTAKAHLLDAGCANGSFAQLLAESGFAVCGADLSQSGIEHARRISPESKFEVASVYDDLCTLFGGPFDIVVSLEVVEHLYDPQTFAQRMYQALKPGGTLIISTPYHGWLKNSVIALTGKHDRHFNPLVVGGHIKFWSRSTLARLLEQAGLQVERFIGAGRFPFLWKSMILVARRNG